MPRTDRHDVPEHIGSGYPAPLAASAGVCIRQALGPAGGLTDFGANLTQLPLGASSSQRHWHTREDEFVYVLSGELVLATNAGEQLMHAGDCATSTKNHPDGHHLLNRSSATVVYLEIGSRHADDACHHPDVDLHLAANEGSGFVHKDRTPYTGP